MSGFFKCRLAGEAGNLKDADDDDAPRSPLKRRDQFHLWNSCVAV